MTDSLAVPAPARSAVADAVRGAAILLVVAFHWFGLPFGWSGVDLFFVLSGYLIGGILIDNRESPAYFRTFYARRLFRIVPLYAVFLAATGLTAGRDLPLWRYLTFTQNFAWVDGGLAGRGFTGLTWSLAVEEQFYLVLPVLIRIVPPRAVPFVSAGCVAAAPACRWALVAAGGMYAPYLLLPGRMDSLFAGVLVAWLSRHPEAMDRLRRYAPGIGCIAFLAFLATGLRFGFSPISMQMYLFGYSFMALAYAGAVMTAIAARSVVPPRLMVAAGIAAYSVYLFHQFIPAVAGTILGITSDGAAAIACWTVATVATAIAAWYLIEQPCIAFARRRWRYGAAMACLNR
jgi:peptidoglycan/LPS O-acetylase OafA/YrhL